MTTEPYPGPYELCPTLGTLTFTDPATGKQCRFANMAEWDERQNNPEIEATARLLVSTPDLLNLIRQMADALQEAQEEIKYWHAEHLDEDDQPPRGSGWKRVYDKNKAALEEARTAPYHLHESSHPRMNKSTNP